MLRGIELRAYPNKEQIILLAKHFGCNRLIHNLGLERRTTEYIKTGKTISKYDMNTWITQLKQTEEYAFLKEVHSQTLQQTMQDLDTAFINYFRNPEKNDYKKKAKKKKDNNPDYELKLEDHKGYPAYQSKKSHRFSIRFPQGGKIDTENNQVFIPKLKWMKVKIHRMIEGEIRSITVKQVPSGKYFVVLLIEDGVPELPLEPINKETAIGIDLGVKDFAILSTGEKVANPKFLSNKEKRLKTLQRRLSRKEKGGKNREKARIKVAKFHEKVYNERKDFLHKLTTKLANDNQVNTYCLETLNTKGMMQNHKLAKSIAEASWCKFNTLLESKCLARGKNIVRIGRFEPSSKLCTCGYKNDKLTLKDREWTCPICHTHHDRDILAANNIKRMALTDANLTSFSGAGRPEEPVESLPKGRAKKQETPCFS
jgi:putative transposase